MGDLHLLCVYLQSCVYPPHPLENPAALKDILIYNLGVCVHVPVGVGVGGGNAGDL